MSERAESRFESSTPEQVGQVVALAEHLWTSAYADRLDMLNPSVALPCTDEAAFMEGRHGSLIAYGHRRFLPEALFVLNYQTCVSNRDGDERETYYAVTRKPDGLMLERSDVIDVSWRHRLFVKRESLGHAGYEAERQLLDDADRMLVALTMNQASAAEADVLLDRIQRALEGDPPVVEQPTGRPTLFSRLFAKICNIPRSRRPE